MWHIPFELLHAASFGPRLPVVPTPYGTRGTCPHFYKWLGMGGHREQNSKQEADQTVAVHHESTHQNVHIEPKTWRGMTKIFCTCPQLSNSFWRHSVHSYRPHNANTRHRFGNEVWDSWGCLTRTWRIPVDQVTSPTKYLKGPDSGPGVLDYLNPSCSVFPTFFDLLSQREVTTLPPIMHEQRYFVTEMPIYFSCTPNYQGTNDKL